MISYFRLRCQFNQVNSIWHRLYRLLVKNIELYNEEQIIKITNLSTCSITREPSIQVSLIQSYNFYLISITLESSRWSIISSHSSSREEEKEKYNKGSSVIRGIRFSTIACYSSPKNNANWHSNSDQSFSVALHRAHY